VDGKLLCWLCTLSYKRALAKAKQNDSSIRHTSISALKSSSRSSSRHKDEMRSHHRHHSHSSGSNNANKSNSASAHKKQRLDLTKQTNGNLNIPSISSNTATITSKTDSSMDVNSSDNVIAVTQLREKVIALDKQLKSKNQELLKKDVKINELKSEISKEQREAREKLTDVQKRHSEKIQDLQQKIAQLSKQNATLTKAAKKCITPNDSPLL
jgi:chromosome segregation ATPase